MFEILIPIALLGLAVNAEPGQVVVFTFLLGTDRPRRNAYAFLAGWVVSMAVCFTAARSVGTLVPKHLGHHAPVAIGIAEIVLAGALAWFALHEWRRRDTPRRTEDRKYLQRLEHVGPRLAFVAGIYEQPWTMTIAAGMVVVHASASTVEATAAALTFAVTSTLKLLGAYLFFEIRGPRAIDELHAAERKVTNLGPRVVAWAAAIAALCFLAAGVHGILTA